MHTKKMLWVAVLLFAALGVTVVAYAQASGDFDLSWNTVDNGGGVSTGGDFGLSGSIGQAEAGSVAGGDTSAALSAGFQLSGGFWFEAVAGYRVLLPLVVKG